MQKKPIRVADLQFGMYIAELDRPWTETPFMFQGFYLRTERQLEALRKHCRQVYIDFGRDDAGAATAPASQPSAAASETIAAASNPGFQMGTAAYRDQTAIEKELHVAAEAYARAVKGLREGFAPFARGSAVADGKQIADCVKRLADSVVRNPDALLLMSKMRDTTEPAHARALQVSIYMMVFARFLQLERDQIHLLGVLGLLQDVGKLRLPAELLETERSPAPDDEAILRKHVDLSAHILAVTPGLPPKLPALALLHHERQDGTGYPRRLKGYQIGMNGAMAAICDHYDALLAPPPYGDGLSTSAALNALLNERGTAFHGPLVEQFIRCIGSFPVGTAVELSSGERGVVIGEDPMQRLKPKVVLVQDRSHKRIARRTIVDLAAKPKAKAAGGEPCRIRRALSQGELKFDPAELFL
jgi:HD-GYP domain-containing protein (c-di-GMP phosphodiesterase class II)